MQPLSESPGLAFVSEISEVALWLSVIVTDAAGHGLVAVRAQRQPGLDAQMHRAVAGERAHRDAPPQARERAAEQRVPLPEHADVDHLVKAPRGHRRTYGHGHGAAGGVARR